MRRKLLEGSQRRTRRLEQCRRTAHRAENGSFAPSARHVSRRFVSPSWIRVKCRTESIRTPPRRALRCRRRSSYAAHSLPLNPRARSPYTSIRRIPFLVALVLHTFRVPTFYQDCISSPSESLQLHPAVDVHVAKSLTRSTFHLSRLLFLYTIPLFLGLS